MRDKTMSKWSWNLPQRYKSLSVDNFWLHTPVQNESSAPEQVTQLSVEGHSSRKAWLRHQ